MKEHLPKSANFPNFQRCKGQAGSKMKMTPLPSDSVGLEQLRKVPSHPHVDGEPHLGDKLDMDIKGKPTRRSVCDSQDHSFWRVHLRKWIFAEEKRSFLQISAGLH